MAQPDDDEILTALAQAQNLKTEPNINIESSDGCSSK